jgi:hypothetical protein
MLLSYNKEKGSHCVAGMNIPKGVVVSEEQSIINIPSILDGHSRCLGASASTKVVVTRCGNPACFCPLVSVMERYCCRSCLCVAYCSASCETTYAWFHSRECDPYLLKSRYSLGIRVLASRLILPLDVFPQPEFVEDDGIILDKIVKRAVTLFKGEYTDAYVRKVLGCTARNDRVFRTVLSGYCVGFGLYLMSTYIQQYVPAIVSIVSDY